MHEPLEEIRPRRTETLRGCADPLTAFKVTIVPLDAGGTRRCVGRETKGCGLEVYDLWSIIQTVLKPVERL